MYYNRIGTDLEISWPISVEEVDDISTLDLSVYVVCNRFRKEMPYALDGNTIVFTFYGIEQKVKGIYSLELVINEGEHGQVICDNKNVFKLYQ